MKRPVISPTMLALVLTIAVGQGASAAVSAAGSTITVPKAGPKTVSASWTGTYRMGTNVFTQSIDDARGNCRDVPDPLKTTHPIKVVVPAGAYSLVKARMVIEVSSSPQLLNADFVELLDPAGNSRGLVGQQRKMTIEVTNPVPGTWKVLACEVVPDSVGDHAYKGKVTITTSCKRTSPCPARATRR